MLALQSLIYQTEKLIQSTLSGLDLSAKDIDSQAGCMAKLRMLQDFRLPNQKNILSSRAKFEIWAYTISK
ncbi:hypothetical protein B1A85_11875 [Chroococcidiopsis sp. TS-821]|nr:hypothetical protein B1A85_11875 [Chroococcidiopsis sp. TS-821]